MQWAAWVSAVPFFACCLITLGTAHEEHFSLNLAEVFVCKTRSITFTSTSQAWECAG